MIARVGRQLPKLETDKRQLLDAADRIAHRTHDPNALFAHLRGREVVVTIEHLGGGSSSNVALASRVGGMSASFVFPAMVHAKSMVVINVPLMRCGTMPVRAVVSACRHIAGHMHEFDVDFREELDSGMFAGRARVIEVPATSESSLTGRCAVLGSSLLDSQVLAGFLTEAGLTATVVESLGGFFDLATTSEVDALLIDCGALGSDPDATLSKIQRLGLRGGVLVLLSGRPEATQPIADESVRTLRLNRPVVPETVSCAMSVLLRDLGREDVSELPSTLHAPAMLALVQEFLDNVQREADQLARLRDNSDFDAAYAIVRGWRDHGATFGYVPLSEAATKTLKSMDACGSLDESARDVRAAISIARRLCLPTPHSQAGSADSASAA